MRDAAGPHSAARGRVHDAVTVEKLADSTMMSVKIYANSLIGLTKEPTGGVRAAANDSGPPSMVTNMDHRMRQSGDRRLGSKAASRRRHDLAGGRRGVGDEAVLGQLCISSFG
ncbi:MAG: hypothetical protein M3548_11505 [Actinomycetota bacterium]|nr:hypothetical protein [Actinomycetota bacterium]